MKDIGLSRLPLIVKVSGIPGGEAAAEEVTTRLRQEFGDQYTRVSFNDVNTVRTKYYPDADPKVMGARKLLDLLMSHLQEPSEKASPPEGKQDSPAQINRTDMQNWFATKAQIERGELAAAVGRATTAGSVTEAKVGQAQGGVDNLDKPVLVQGVGLSVRASEKNPLPGLLSTRDFTTGPNSVTIGSTENQFQVSFATKQGEWLDVSLHAWIPGIAANQVYRCALSDGSSGDKPSVSLSVQNRGHPRGHTVRSEDLEDGTYAKFYVRQLERDQWGKLTNADVTFKLLAADGSSLLSVRFAMDVSQWPTCNRTSDNCYLRNY